MKKLVLFAALAAVSACNSNEPIENVVVDENAMAAEEPAEAEVSMAIDGQPDAGTYSFTKDDGSQMTVTINADNTLSIEANGTTSAGTWTKNGDATYCLTMEGATEATCYTDTMDGTTWLSTNDADPADSWVVVRVS